MLLRHYFLPKCKLMLHGSTTMPQTTVPPRCTTGRHCCLGGRLLFTPHLDGELQREHEPWNLRRVGIRGMGVDHHRLLHRTAPRPYQGQRSLCFPTLCRPTHSERGLGRVTNFEPLLVLLGTSNLEVSPHPKAQPQPLPAAPIAYALFIMIPLSEAGAKGEKLSFDLDGAHIRNLQLSHHYYQAKTPHSAARPGV